MIERNVGGLDRTLRGVLGGLFAAAGAVALAGVVAVPSATLVGVVALLAGAGLLANAVTGRCLGNRLLGIDTCPAPVED